MLLDDDDDGGGDDDVDMSHHCKELQVCDSEKWMEKMMRSESSRYSRHGHHHESDDDDGDVCADDVQRNESWDELSVN